MADKKSQALERLLTKLSAIRKTVRGEERGLLDQVVLGAQFQASAGSKLSEPSEVELHGVRKGADNKLQQSESRLAGEDLDRSVKSKRRIHNGSYKLD